MFKRNDGYALSYVLVVLMVLAIIATAVMAPPLRNLQMQQASIERMQDKYVAQGIVEQVVAQLENAAAPLEDSDIISLANGNDRLTISKQDEYYIIIAKSNFYNITAKIGLIKNFTTEEIDGATQEKFDGYTVSYEAYNISYNTEVGS